MFAPKYIMFRGDGGQGVPYPVIFPHTIEHAAMARTLTPATLDKDGFVRGLVPVSAGYVDLDRGEVYGESVSLDLQSNPEFDNRIIKRDLLGEVE